jgi:hypothetical protein
MNQTFNRRNPKITNRRNPKITNRRNTKRKNRRNTKRKNRRNTKRKNRRNTKRTNIKNRKGGDKRNRGDAFGSVVTNPLANGAEHPPHLKRQESEFGTVVANMSQRQINLIDFIERFTITNSELRRDYFKKRMSEYSSENLDNLFDKFQTKPYEHRKASELLFLLFNVLPFYYGFLDIRKITGKNKQFEDKITHKFEYKPENESEITNPLRASGSENMAVNNVDSITPHMYLCFDYYNILWNIILINWKLYYLFLDLYMYQNLLDIIRQIYIKSAQNNLKVFLFACSENIPNNLDVSIVEEDHKDHDAFIDIINIELEEIKESIDSIFEELIGFFSQLKGIDDKDSKSILKYFKRPLDDMGPYEYIELLFSDKHLPLGPFIYEKYCDNLQEILNNN